MNELFNWGGETPEQRQARLQWEQELLLEQARVKFNMMAMTGGAAGGGGAPSGYPIECDPSKGIGMYLTLDAGAFGVIKVLIRMEYQGDDEAGQPTYGYTIVGGVSGATLNYDYGVGKWKFALIAGNTDIYYSDTLISSNWDGTASPETPAAGFTTCGYPELPVYCIDTGDLLVQPAPTWLDSQDENTETPPIWAGFVLTFVWLPLLSPGNDGWYLFNDETEGGVEGGSINSLPLGEVPLGEGSVTVSAGACEF